MLIMCYNISMDRENNIRKQGEAASMEKGMNVYKVSEELEDGTEIQAEHFAAMEDAERFARDILNLSLKYPHKACETST